MAIYEIQTVYYELLEYVFKINHRNSFRKTMRHISDKFNVLFPTLIFASRAQVHEAERMPSLRTIERLQQKLQTPELRVYSEKKSAKV